MAVIGSRGLGGVGGGDEPRGCPAGLVVDCGRFGLRRGSRRIGTGRQDSGRDHDQSRRDSRHASVRPQGPAALRPSAVSGSKQTLKHRHRSYLSSTDRRRVRIRRGSLPRKPSGPVAGQLSCFRASLRQRVSLMVVAQRPDPLPPLSGRTNRLPSRTNRPKTPTIRRRSRAAGPASQPDAPACHRTTHRYCLRTTPNCRPTSHHGRWQIGPSRQTNSPAAPPLLPYATVPY